MTEPSTGTRAQAGPMVDRRWFEESLRAQGFVVEPPAVDVEPPAVDVEPQASAPPPKPVEVRPVGPRPVEVSTDEPRADRPTAGERPPVPSALLARIAARGQGAPTTTDRPPDAVATPWTGAVMATVAPWATSVGAETTPSVGAPSSGIAAAPVASSQDDSPGSVSHDIGDDHEGHGRPTEREQIADPAPIPAPEPQLDALGPVPVDTLGSLASPYVQAITDAAVPPSAAPVAGSPEASEGELWALVSGSEASAAQAPGSGPVRVLLTILTAVGILVIVVGSLVLASQLA